MEDGKRVGRSKLTVIAIWVLILGVLVLILGIIVLMVMGIILPPEVLF